MIDRDSFSISENTRCAILGETVFHKSALVPGNINISFFVAPYKFASKYLEYLQKFYREKWSRALAFTLHVQPPHLYNVGASLPFEERFVAVPAERVRLIENVQGN